jgi:hypothetical protein
MPNNVTFNIKETPEGEFVLILHNHGRELVLEEHRSRDIDEIVEVLKEKMDYRRHFNNAMLTELQVLGQARSLEKMSSEAAKESYPDNWEDPLELYGCYLKGLEEEGMNLDHERNQLLELLKDHSPEYVWSNRYRLVAERIWIPAYFILLPFDNRCLHFFEQLFFGCHR